MLRFVKGLFSGAEKPDPPPAPPPQPTAPQSPRTDPVADLLAAQPETQSGLSLSRPGETPAGRLILALSVEDQAEAVSRLLIRFTQLGMEMDRREAEMTPRQRENLLQDKTWEKLWREWHYLARCLEVFARRKLPLPAATLRALAVWAGGCKVERWGMPHGLLCKLFEDHAPGNDAAMRDGVAAYAGRLRAYAGQVRETRKLADRLDAVLGIAKTCVLTAGEVWADAARACIEDASNEHGAAWRELLAHAASASAASPNAKWLRTAEQLLGDAAFAAEFCRLVAEWFPLVDRPAPGERGRDSGGWRSTLHPLQLSDVNQDILRGLAWCCGLRADAELARALAGLCLGTLKKLPGTGPRAPRVANACIWALGNMPDSAGLSQLALLKIRVKFGTAQKAIAKALAKVAQDAGVSPEELEEMAAPAYGMEAVGVREEVFGEFTARLEITGTTSTEITWRKADGKTQKSVPAVVKEQHAEDWKELKSAAADIVKMLPAQRDRLDSLYLENRTWTFPVWRERYLDHPLVGTLARRLIWNFVRGERHAAAIWHDGKLVDRQGNAVDWPDETTRVELWHPIRRTTEEILGWRHFLEEFLIQQPFKQAHREVYLLTDAELNTRVYSNRFAAHIIKQHQFNALCGVRGWKNKLRLMVDDEYPPASRPLPAWNLRAEFWIEGIGDQFGQDTNDAGAFLRLSTDQVRFYRQAAAQRTAHAVGGGYGTHRGAADEPVPLAEIPPLVFSEIMRDVDLFVGVASVGNDPTWSDGGPDGRYRAYWHDVSFGALTETAKTRREVLERLLPRLKIASVCELADKFLVVRGSLRTYKIHLGSGNILMLPDDQYLCIVPKSSAEDAPGRVALPFEGDRTLSIILSKAFLLAADDKISDETITRQIGRKS